MKLSGIYRSVLTLMSDGEQKQLQLDPFGRLITTVGAGTAGVPGGEVASVQSPGAVNKTATIAINASLSDVVDLGAGAALVGILMPAAWDAAGISFQVSPDNATFGNKFDALGSEYLVPSNSAGASKYIALPVSDWVGCRYVRVRSGPSGAAVNQTAARSLVLVAAS